ncbi:hypothetical protein [Ulvibacter antarcticus]|uniref:Uncharacterized protein n=1 Tax=Ulvibacter antarcticus TaxID=442714 RepID=A0A3L9YEA6_9FLAO|nr:hypothetical protein [Ulvibacter antarcticus]RMA57787.1 hypothetical protein BXY75_2592 [Ulvibacter antarcticus]
MKTTTTYIAIATLLLTFTGVFAQNIQDESQSSNADYLAKKELDLQAANRADLDAQPIIVSENQNKLAAAERINYQAVARDAGGVLMANTAVTVDFEIRDGAGGPAVFNETHNLVTNVTGVFSTQIGNTVSLANVNWLDINAWLQVDLNGTDVGETRMGSVPTALHSKNSGAVMIYGSGTNNADKMIAQHSPAFPGWGIGYNDATDVIDFMSGGTKTMRVDLGNGSISTNSNVEVLQTTTTPALNRVYGNSMPIAYGSIDSGGSISTGYGITSVSNTGAGTYDIVLNHDTNISNSIVMITPFTGAIGVPEICGYNPTGTNTFTVNIQTVGGAGQSSAFAFVVYGNH